jgi:lipopolysaccharide heptosyltransferase II
MASFKTYRPKKVLIINIFGLGDVLFTTPLINNLKADYPDVVIGYVCNRRSSCILENNKKINKIFIYERDAFEAIAKKSRFKYIKAMLDFFNGIKKEGYNTVIDVSLSNFTDFFTWFIGIPNRIALNYKGRSFFATRKIPFEGYQDKHVVEHYLDFLKEIGVSTHLHELDLPLSEKDVQWADYLWVENGWQNKRVIALVPGGGDSWGKDAHFKRWSPENYAKLADKIVEKTSAITILLGGENEQEICTRILSSMRYPAVSLCGKTTIGQFASIVQRCSCVILNDGGPLHVSVAAKATTVSIFGPVDDNIYGPYPRGKHQVVVKDLACRPCYRKFRRASCNHISCLGTITVDEVFRKVEQVLQHR